jgi:hypothetical protein
MREGSGNEGSMQARVGLLKIPSPNRWERVRVRASVQTQGTRGGKSPAPGFSCRALGLAHSLGCHAALFVRQSRVTLIYFGPLSRNWFPQIASPFFDSFFDSFVDARFAPGLRSPAVFSGMAFRFLSRCMGRLACSQVPLAHRSREDQPSPVSPN